MIHRNRAWGWVAAAAFVLPLAAFTVLRANPGWDLPIEAPLEHFYVVTFTSFVALVAALFVASSVHQARSARVLFVTLGFAAIAAIFMLHGLATPGILVPGFNQAVGWSARLSLAAGSLFFVLASLPWSPEQEALIHRQRDAIWALAGALYLLYATVAFGYPQPLERLSRMEPGINFALGGAATLGYLWAAWRAVRGWQQGGASFEGFLATSLSMLAAAQVSMLFGPLYLLSWWLYHGVMLVGFALSVLAIAAAFEALRDFRPARYFAALGSVVAVGLALLSGELTVRLLGMPELRLALVGLGIIVACLLFVALYLIVRRADRLITERTLALKHEQHLRRELTQIIIHDLKNPLAAIVGSLSAVDMGVEISGPQARFIHHSKQAANNAVRLIDDLLDVERLEAGALRLESAAFGLGPLLEERIGAVQGLAEQLGGQVQLDVADPLPQLVADRRLLARVVDNLLSNAIRYTPRGGSIAVKAHDQDGRLEVRIEDQGPGVPPSERERIFEKFVQAAGTERRGAGLGLAFCKMAIEAHGGTIAVSEAPGGGAAFTFDLPAAD